MNGLGLLNQTLASKVSTSTIPKFSVYDNFQSSTVPNSPARKVSTPDPAPSARINLAKPEECCIICFTEIDLASRDSIVFPCKHTYHRKCMDQWISHLNTPKITVLNPKFKCPTCAQVVPVSIPVWDNENQAFVCTVNKKELQSPLPYVGVPMTFPLPSGMDESEVTVALAFKGTPWLSLQRTTPVQLSEDGRAESILPLVLDDGFCFLHYLSVPEAVKDVKLGTKMLVAQACCPEPILHILKPKLETATDAAITFNPPLVFASRAPLPLRLILDQLDTYNVLKSLEGKSIASIDSPLYSIKWFPPRTDWKKTDSGPQCLTIDGNETALLKTIESSASIPKTKWSEVFRFKLAIISEDHKTTYAELAGLSFLEPGTSGVFSDAVSADPDLKNSNAFQQFRESYKKAIDALGPDDNFCIRIQLQRHNEISDEETADQQEGGEKELEFCNDSVYKFCNLV